MLGKFREIMPRQMMCKSYLLLGHISPKFTHCNTLRTLQFTIVHVLPPAEPEVIELIPAPLTATKPFGAFGNRASAESAKDGNAQVIGESRGQSLAVWR